MPSGLATFDLRAETMFWAIENPSPPISEDLDGGFCELYVCEPLNRSLILGIRARADGENLGLLHGGRRRRRAGGRRRRRPAGALARGSRSDPVGIRTHLVKNTPIGARILPDVYMS